MSFKYIIIFIYTIVAIDESNTMAQPVQCHHYMEDSLKTNIVYHAISPYLYSISCFHIYIFICTPTEAQRGNRNQQPWQRQWTQRQPPVIPASPTRPVCQRAQLCPKPRNPSSWSQIPQRRFQWGLQLRPQSMIHGRLQSPMLTTW